MSGIHMGIGCLGPHSLDLSISWRWVVRFMPLTFYLQGRAPGTQWIGAWVNTGASLDDMEKLQFLTQLGLKLWPLSHPSHSQSLYQLCNYISTHDNTSSFNNFDPKIWCWTYVRFEIIMVVTVKNGVFLDVMPCGCCKNQHLGGMYHQHLQGENSQWTRNTSLCIHGDE
jgi:hypothetical protein